MALPEQIRNRRAELGLTQAQVAERAGLSRQQFASIERGVSDASLSRLERIAGALAAELVLIPEGSNFDFERILGEHAVYRAVLRVTHESLVRLARSIEPEAETEQRVNLNKIDINLMAALREAGAEDRIAVYVMRNGDGQRIVQVIHLTPAEIAELSWREDVQIIHLVSRHR